MKPTYGYWGYGARCSKCGKGFRWDEGYGGVSSSWADKWEKESPEFTCFGASHVCQHCGHIGPFKKAIARNKRVAVVVTTKTTKEEVSVEFQGGK